MTMPLVERRIRRSAVLISSGLLILLVTLFWKGPLSFMAFLVLGCPLVLAGALLYLYALATRES